MYSVKTRCGSTYNSIKSWMQSTLDERFIEFVWSDGILILPKDEILAIETTLR